MGKGRGGESDTAKEYGELRWIKMDIKYARIGQRAKYREHEGEIIRIVRGMPGGCITIKEDGGACYVDHAALFAPIAPDACEMAATITSQCKQIAELRKERDGWRDATFSHVHRTHNCLEQLGKARTEAATYKRNAAYWREELTNLQKEELEEGKERRQTIVEAYRAAKTEPIHPVIRVTERSWPYCNMDMVPLGEVAKIYIQISPSVLAKIIAEREE
jgi:hypothetical protein